MNLGSLKAKKVCSWVGGWMDGWASKAILRIACSNNNFFLFEVVKVALVDASWHSTFVKFKFILLTFGDIQID